MRPNNQNNTNRQRSRNGGRKHVNPLSRNFESNGPDVKVRGNAAHVAEKYLQLARDAQSSGDSVMAENYLQHAEHYFRVLRALQPQRSFQEIAQREQIGQGFDIDFEDESGAQAAAFLAAQQAADRQAQQGQGGHNQGGQGSGQNNGPNGNQGPAQNAGQNERSGDDNDNDGARRESRRDRWERRRDSRRGQYERDEAEGGTAQAGDEPSQPVAKAEETVAEQPKPRRRGRAEAAPSDTDAGPETALPGFLTRATPAPSNPTAQDAVEEKPAPRRRAPRRKAETPVDEQA